MTSMTFRAGLTAALLAVPVLAQAPDADAHQLVLKYGKFDPAAAELAIPMTLRGARDTKLWIVQFAGRPTETSRAAVRASGGRIHSYLPRDAYVVRMPIGSAAAVRNLASVRYVGYYHPAFRLEAFLRAEQAQAEQVPTRRYNLVVTDKHSDKPALAQKINAIGGKVSDEMDGSILFSATLTGAQLLQVARFDEVLWIDRWGAPEDDMDNARIQGGANYIETAGGYTGKGIIGHQYEGLNAGHNDWNNRPIGFPAGCTSSSGHGHNTAGIVYGNGRSSPKARGMAPDAQAYFTSCRTNRWANFNLLVNTHNIMFTTASWGSPRTRQYTSVSAEADDICFDHDLVWTNSQSNASTQDSRAEAWAKNVFAIGGVAHRDNSNPGDDSWRAGGASIGPAADGRMKPDFCAYYDNIATSSSSGGFTLTFGGTSGATPIVAGHNALAIQMFTDGVFGNRLRKPGGTRFQNKPKFTTLKALQVVNAAQYNFTSSSNDNRREHQGWGFPSLRSMWDNRAVTYIVDEEDVITQGVVNSYVVNVAAGRSDLRISMSFADVAGNPAAAIAAVNDLSLRVRAPNGTIYLGNAGLKSGTLSTTGGSLDRLNTIENVFVRNPLAGNWTIEVSAPLVAVDTHIETAQIDADYGMVVNGATFVSKTAKIPGIFSTFGAGCDTSIPKLGAICELVNSVGFAATATKANTSIAIEMTASKNLSVVGFSFLGSATGGNQTVAAALYLDDGTGKPGQKVATGTLKLKPGFAQQEATFGAPVAIASGQKYFFGYQNGAAPVQHNTQSGGVSVNNYELKQGVWTSAGSNSWNMFVYCFTGFNQAVISSVTAPEINKSMTLNLSLAKDNAATTLLTGFSKQTWSGGVLPFDLASIGAAGCSLLVSNGLTLSGNTNASGAASITIPIPNNKSLIGVKLYQQFFTLDAKANTLGLTVSNAAELEIGG